MYATPAPTLQEHRNRITDSCASVSPAMLYNVQRDAQSRVQMCIVAEGHYFEQIDEPHFRQVQFCSTRSNQYAFCALHLYHFCAQDVFCNKSMMLNNFVMDIFPVFCTVFEIRTLTPNFAARWRCKRFPCVTHGNFTIPIPHFYEYSSRRS
ncbi:hypothetical protein AVEN_261084-1 [Araneus ventricosus]|uniref:Uncharacterized protein n=1 Tax=Araneus ventricosus TaxID=182803 RepID=A0A4Y2RIK5_ARAVE|nr:hypothetical protein AVEN_261084-1 [Araneus ventricosus]